MLASASGFLAVATLLIIAPGPDSLLVLRHAVARGRTGGFVTAAGTLTGLCGWAVAASVGLAALVRASQVGYDVLRLAGAAYLVWLGIAALRSRHTTDADADPRPRVGLWRMYAAGAISNLANPKIGIFFVAFLPGFVPSGAPVAASSLLFGALFVAETGLWLALVSILVVRGARQLRSPRVRVVLDRVTGVVLIGFGVRLASEVRVAS